MIYTCLRGGTFLNTTCMNFLAKGDFAEVLWGGFGKSFVFNGLKTVQGCSRAKQLPVTVLFCCLVVRSHALYRMRSWGNLRGRAGCRHVCKPVCFQCSHECLSCSRPGGLRGLRGCTLSSEIPVLLQRFGVKLPTQLCQNFFKPSAVSLLGSSGSSLPSTSPFAARAAPLSRGYFCSGPDRRGHRGLFPRPS